jgi:hypothetical protein
MWRVMLNLELFIAVVAFVVALGVVGWLWVRRR